MLKVAILIVIEFYFIELYQFELYYKRFNGSQHNIEDMQRMRDYLQFVNRHGGINEFRVYRRGQVLDGTEDHEAKCYWKIY